MRGIGIRTGLRHERCPGEPRADMQNLEHRSQCPIGSDAQRPIADNLKRHVPVAKVPGDAGQLARGCNLDVDDFLGRGEDADVAAFGKAQTGTIGQRNRALQIEEKG